MHIDYGEARNWKHYARSRRASDDVRRTFSLDVDVLPRNVLNVGDTRISTADPSSMHTTNSTPLMYIKNHASVEVSKIHCRQSPLTRALQQRTTP